MKPPSFLAVSLMGNLVLAAVWLVDLRQGSTVQTNVPSPTNCPPSALREGKPIPAATATPGTASPWSLVASADYPQYIAHLRAVGCPDWLIRDIIVAAIDDAYQQKTKSDLVCPPPWTGADQRRQASRSRSAKLFALRQAKRALVKSLLGYEWDSHADDVWNQDLPTSLMWGFLPDDKVLPVLFLRDKFTEAAQAIREDANYILIDEDRTRLLALYAGLEADLSGQLDASELDELQLRAQQGFLLFYDMNFDGVAISRDELRELVRMSKPFKDMAQDDFVPDRPLSEAEQARQKAAFEAQIKSLLGPKRFADYRRAQDFNFRESLAFTRQNQLSQAAAISLYEARCNADAQAAEIQKDGTLSPEERATAVAVLKAATMNAISPVLGSRYHNYLEGPGSWLDALVQQSEPPTQMGMQ
ncbi:MAG: hypothetical protein WAO02_02015 [Verrucomicrobiia bacterium]